MQKFKLAISLSALVALSACSMGPSNSHGGSQYLFGYPIPTGYALQNNPKQPLLKPPADTAEDVAAPVTSHDGSVTVFPIDGEAWAPVTSYPVTQNAPAAPYEAGYGRVAQQIFFVHGSSALSTSERALLRELAQDLSSSASEIAVTVVGHASKRVDGVSDPVQRKLINFEMAQKRANSVTQALTQSGLSPAWVQAVSKGDEAPNPTPGGRTQEEADRRVDIHVK